MRRIVLVLVFVAFQGWFGNVTYVAAQTEEFELGGEEGEAEEIETDRDSFTPATTLVTPGRFLTEAAYTFQDNRSVKETHSFPELLVRYGWSDLLELRLGWNYEIGGAGNTVSSGSGDEFSEAGLEQVARINYGAKLRASTQDGWVPESVVILMGSTPTGGDFNDTRFVATYAFGWVLANEWKWDNSIRYASTSEEEDHFNVWAPSTVLKVPLAEQWNAHIEYFGLFSEGKELETSPQYVSPGIHYLVTPDLEVGVRIGWGLNDDSANFFTNAGLGWLY